ncbi:GtrA family protein [Demequina lignilytica]|uniref:GtrA family protein n=1 Tax=Demequina lignilytica TaxID=3051663 RepID=A0AB35MKI2_9MICO|nr:GtrA family protein [Demequina sp. SYSU T0a273]MDN4484311.1 GtrA family protein [Demequina sp. SYSU T0a273]
MTTNARGRGLRFVAVGIANTAIDFGTLAALTVAGMAPLAANIVSTSVALAFSFVANRTFTFRSSGHPGRQLALFLVVTLAGLWGLQSLVILGVTSALGGSGVPEYLVLAAAKVAATVASLTWNYMLYARVVFRDAVER